MVGLVERPVVTAREMYQTENRGRVGWPTLFESFFARGSLKMNEKHRRVIANQQVMNLLVTIKVLHRCHISKKGIKDTQRQVLSNLQSRN